jgi:ribose 1,5-bisphosphokinase
MKPQSDIAMRVGRLVYVVGPSGAGKDSIIAYARQRLGKDRHVFARRHITRPADSGGEDHIAITLSEFEQDCAAGRYALAWRGNGLGYGVGIEIDLWLQSGRHVVLNGSRGHLAMAAERYSTLLPVLIAIDPAVLRQRLSARGRESADEIDARIRRAAELGEITHSALAVVANNGPLAEAGEAFVALLEAL